MCERTAATFSAARAREREGRWGAASGGEKMTVTGAGPRRGAGRRFYGPPREAARGRADGKPKEMPENGKEARDGAASQPARRARLAGALGRLAPASEVGEHIHPECRVGRGRGRCSRRSGGGAELFIIILFFHGSHTLFSL